MVRRSILAFLAAALLALPMAGQEASSSEAFNRAVFFGGKFFSLGEYSSAYEQFAKAEAIYPDHPALIYNLAVVLFKLGRFSEAQVRIDRYTQLYPHGTELPQVTRLQMELEFERELQKTRQAAQSYLELFNRGKFLFGKGDVDGALRVFQEAEQQRPEDPAVVYNQALACEAKGDYARATEKLRRYASLIGEASDKSATDQKIFVLEAEMQDMKTKIACPFCGAKLSEGATWCHHCWHGPYLTKSPQWNARPCGAGASATRTLSRPDGRIERNEDLPCQTAEGGYVEALRYSPARQQAIRRARTSEGWTYSQARTLEQWTDSDGNKLELHHGPDFLESVVSPATGEVLHYAAHRAGENWLLDREDVVIEGQRYAKTYTFDDKGQITQETVQYRASSACNHLITTTATYAYANGRLETVAFHGEYEGYPIEGLPKTTWDALLTYTYDDKGRVQKEDLVVSSHTKTWALKPQDKHRDELELIHRGMRVKKPLDILGRGDLCAVGGATPIGNPIDLRPFYTVSPNVAMALPFGVNRVTVAFTYPDGYRAGR